MVSLPEPWVRFALLAAVLFALGNALQKHGLAGRLRTERVGTLAARPARVLRAFASSRFWLLGTALTFAAVAAETQALALGEASAVKPFSDVQALFVVAIGIGVLGERLAGREWLGVALTLCGVLALASEPSDASIATRSLGATLALGAGVSCAVLLAAVLGDRRPSRPAAESALALAAGTLFGLGDVMTKAATEGVRAQIGGFDLARADTLTTFAVAPAFYLGLAVTIAAFLLQQLAFSRGRVSLAAPLVGVASTSCVVLLGVAFLGESLGPRRMLGVALTLLGSGLLAVRAAARSRPETP